MNAKIKLIYRDKTIKYTGFAVLFLVFVQTILLAFFYREFPPLVPFFNSLSWGEIRLAPAFVLIAIPVSIIFIYTLNMYIAIAITKQHALIARMLSVNVFLVSLLATVALIQIMLLVF